MKIEIYSARESDYQLIVELNKQFELDLPNFPWTSPHWVLDEISKGHYFVIAIDTVIVGCMCLEKTNNNVAIETIAVDSKVHKHGLGKQLIDFAKEYARAHDASSLTVGTFIEYGLLPFYEKQGFEHDSPPTDYYEGKKYHCLIAKI
jgi:[ribosomal protein S18]-alanine N-acetyltransferase